MLQIKRSRSYQISGRELSGPLKIYWLKKARARLQNDNVVKCIKLHSAGCPQVSRRTNSPLTVCHFPPICPQTFSSKLVTLVTFKWDSFPANDKLCLGKRYDMHDVLVVGDDRNNGQHLIQDVSKIPNDYFTTRIWWRP
jgi:hypothetical protein